jgi:hypothetical protein
VLVDVVSEPMADRRRGAIGPVAPESAPSGDGEAR